MITMERAALPTHEIPFSGGHRIYSVCSVHGPMKCRAATVGNIQSYTLSVLDIRSIQYVQYVESIQYVQYVESIQYVKSIQ